MNDSTHSVGVIGLGLLGAAICQRLGDASYAVVGYDVDRQRRDVAAKIGVDVVESVADVAKLCRQLILCLPDSDVVARVVDEIEPALVAGTTVIDTTTGSPDAAALVGQRLAAHECDFLEANVVGSSDHMRAHDAVILVGGGRDTFVRHADLLDALGRECFHVGEWGCGARMKLVVNLVLGLNRAVLAEGLSLAESCGFDGAQALDVLTSGLAYSRVMDVKGPKMLTGDFTPQARLAQHLKDVHLILAAGRDCGQSLPLSEINEQLLARAVQLGFADADNSAVIKAFKAIDPS